MEAIDPGTTGRGDPTAQKRGRRLQRRKATCARYDVCSRTLERWEKDPALNFPKPTIINGRKYDDPDALDAWDESRG